MSTPSALRDRRRGRTLLLSAIAELSLSVFASGQNAGILRTSAEIYRDTIPGESVDGIALDFRQLLPAGGLLNAEAVLVEKKNEAGFGRGLVRIGDVPLLGGRVTAEAGDFPVKLDASPFHLATDSLPIANVRGGSVRAETRGAAFSLFLGRNEQFQGIRLPTVVFAPEYLAGATATYEASPSVTLDANALRTSNRRSAENPLFGVQVPREAETYGVGGTVRLLPAWTAQARGSLARYTYAPGSLYASGQFLSWVAGTVLDTDRWKAQVDYVREGINYVPLSTGSNGNREGPHVLLQSSGERLHVTASFAAYRNNLESNPGVPDLESRSAFGSIGYRLTPSVFGIATLNQQNLSSERAGEVSRFLQRTAAAELGFPTFGHTRMRYQFQTTDEPSLRQRLHEVELEQQPPPVRGINVVAALRFQRSAEGSSSLLYRAAINGSIRDLHLSLQGEWGRDLAAANVFALNRNQTITAIASLPLPGALELRLEGYWNRVAAVVNPESIFVAQATQEQLFSFNRRAMLVKVARVFEWGRAPAGAPALGGVARALPYGTIEGFVFQDLDANGVRGAGEPAAAGIAVRLDDGQIASTDRTGRFVFANVIEGEHVVSLDTEVLPVSYNAPAATSARVRVRRLTEGRHDFGLIPTGSLSGRVEQALATGERAGFAGAVVTLLPGGLSTYTDAEGRYSFSNLSPGRYAVRLEEASLPEGARVEKASSDEALAAAQELAIEPLVFFLVVEEKPVQKIFEGRQTVPSAPVPPKKPANDSGRRPSSRENNP